MLSLVPYGTMKGKKIDELPPGWHVICGRGKIVKIMAGEVNANWECAVG